MKNVSFFCESEINIFEIVPPSFQIFKFLIFAGNLGLRHKWVK